MGSDTHCLLYKLGMKRKRGDVYLSSTILIVQPLEYL